VPRAVAVLWRRRLRKRPCTLLKSDRPRLLVEIAFGAPPGETF
jgi:hypothetical protein